MNFLILKLNRYQSQVCTYSTRDLYICSVSHSFYVVYTNKTKQNKIANTIMHHPKICSVFLSQYLWCVTQYGCLPTDMEHKSSWFVIHPKNPFVSLTHICCDLWHLLGQQHYVCSRCACACVCVALRVWTYSINVSWVGKRYGCSCYVCHMLHQIIKASSFLIKQIASIHPHWTLAPRIIHIVNSSNLSCILINTKWGIKAPILFSIVRMQIIGKKYPIKLV